MGFTVYHVLIFFTSFYGCCSNFLFVSYVIINYASGIQEQTRVIMLHGLFIRLLKKTGQSSNPILSNI